MKVKFRFILIVFAVFCLVGLTATKSNAQFGQNKVQYKVFDWSYLQSKHFDVYFNRGGGYIAQFAAVAAESSLVSLEENIGYSIKNRIPIIVFNSHNDFQQNNIVDEYLPEGVGGVTELFKNRITVPFEGDNENFRHVIHHELLHAYMNDMYYGGSLQNIIASNIRLQFPTWFSEGMAEYQSLGGNNKNNDMFMRDAVIYDYLPEIDYVDGYLAYRGGQSFFSWLAEEYGEEKIGDLMQQIRAYSDVYEGFEEVYKLDIDELSEKWHKHLKQIYWPDISTRQEVTDFAKRITNHRKGDGFYNTAPAISPNGEYIAYISNRDDYFDVLIADVKTGKVIEKLIEGNVSADFEELHLLTPGLCWSPDGRKIAISVKSGDKDAVHIINVNTGDEKVLPIKFDGIFSVEWNPNYNSLVFVGNNSKQSDIWIYDLKTKKLQAVTNDMFSDSDPNWSKDGEKIYFTSDRGNYTDPKSIPRDLNMSVYDHLEKDLYVYDIKSNTISRFTNVKNAEESNVVSSADGKKVLYISDRNGINNIWLRNLETGEENPITNSLDPIYMLSLSQDGKRLAFSSLNHGGYDIFYIENPFEIDLKMKELPNTVFVEQQIAESKSETGKDTLTALIDSLKEVSKIDTNSTNINQFLPEDVLKSNNPKDTLSGIYGENISLDLNPQQQDSEKTTLGKLKLKEKSKFKISDNTNEDGSFKFRKYKIKFSPDIIYSNVGYSSFYGVQGTAQMAFSDILGNHRIYVVTSLVLDLKNSDYAIAYYYLPKRIDYGFEAYHSARFLLIRQNGIDQLYRYRTYGFNTIASYPLNKFNRLDGALSVTSVSKENLDDPNQEIQRLYYALPVLSYVHDNTLWGFTSPIRGTRYNLTFLGTPKIGANGVSFASGIGDFRTYIKLFEDYNFAWRLSGGASFGKNPQRFYIGGTSNWINYQIENDVIPVEDLNDFAFSTPVLPLRGYNYNTRSGSKFALMNAEFRFPLFKYLVLGAPPLAFQNVLGILFLDVGTVWSKNKDLQLFTRSNGTIITKDLLIGMGMGTRIFLLYIPFKFDVAWTYDLQVFSKPKYYISLGVDF